MGSRATGHGVRVKLLNLSGCQMQILLYAAALLYLERCSSTEPPAACPTRCDVSTCPSPSCPSGYVPDRCNCCLVCALAEGDACGRKDDLPCGDGLTCKHPAAKRLSKGFCQCKLSYDVCGSDGKTYGNVCQLKAASRKTQQQGLSAITQVQKGPCDTRSGTVYALVASRQAGARTARGKAN